MNHYPESKPRFLMDDKVEPEVKDWVRVESPTKFTLRDKWAERLWPCMAWSIFLFNLVLAVNFGWEVWQEDTYDYTKHVTVAVTMCASYVALIWTHKNILRKDNGLD